MKSKLGYLATSFRKSLTRIGATCPNCGTAANGTVDTKYCVTRLLRCGGCKLLFRAPTTSKAESEAFYQRAYTQGFTTDMPNDEELRQYLHVGFPVEKDYSRYLDIVKAATGSTQRRLFDFGCSWGYGSYQFMQGGFEVEAFEISRPRAAYASHKLGVKVHADISAVTGEFDVFFSSHVLEHVSAVQEAIDFAFNVLSPGGVFIAVTPNGSMDFRRLDPRAWHKFWGMVHPNLLDVEFYAKTFADSHYFLTSSPYLSADISNWKDHPRQMITNVGKGAELLVIARKGDGLPSRTC
jgi:2-polyprenyl-3-methyl-5-hydroxy-6-metoxy-1,4-benzoquinol methylase